MLSQYISYITRLPSELLGEIAFDIYMLSDSTKKIIYITSISTGISQYYIERICDKNVTLTKIRRVYIWELRKFINNRDAVMIDMYKLFARFFNDRDGFLVPYRINEVLDITHIDKIIRHKNQKLKKVYKYNYEISKDLDALKFFYEKMHIPYLKKRFGDHANIENFDIIEKIFKRGDLIFIKLGDEYISGSLCEMNGHVYYIKKFGVIDESFIKDGALVAVYYFSILLAKERHAKIVDLGGTKPFLSDGVLRHKISWGAKICEDKTNKRVIYLKNISFKEPFIYIKDKKLKADIFLEDKMLIRAYTNKGVELNIKS